MTRSRHDVARRRVAYYAEDLWPAVRESTRESTREPRRGGYEGGVPAPCDRCERAPRRPNDTLCADCRREVEKDYPGVTL